MSWERRFQLLSGEDLPPEWDHPCVEVPLEPQGAGFITARRVVFPMFEITSNPSIPLSMIRERRFDLIERAQTPGRAQTQASEIQASEDARVLQVLGALMTEYPASILDDPLGQAEYDTRQRPG